MTSLLATKKRVGILLTTFALALVLTACGPFKAPVEAAQSWFVMLREDPSSAYQATHPTFKEYTAEADFNAFIENVPELTMVKEARFNQWSIEGNEAEIRGTLRFDDGSTGPVLVILIDDGEWLVAGIDLDPPVEEETDSEEL